MRLPAAKKGDRIIANDIHTVMVPAPGTEVPTPALHPFNGTFNNDRNLSSTVNIMGSPAATIDSLASDPQHLQLPPVPVGATRFFKNPDNKGKAKDGSPTVRINGRPAVRHGDVAVTCNDPSDQPIGQVIASGSVLFG